MVRMFSSNRIYKNELEKTIVDAIEQTIVLFNRAKHTSYNRIMREERSGVRKNSDSEHMQIKKEFELDDYWANSVVQEAKAVHSSQKELRKMYQENTAARIEKLKSKIKNLKSEITVLEKIKKSFVNGKPKFNKTSKEQQKGSFFVVQYKKQTDLYYNAYDFEHLYLDKKIKELKTKLGLIQGRLNNEIEKGKRLKTKIVGVTFGTKKLFKAQHTIEHYEKNHDIWLKEWEKSRYNQFVISGRKDAKNGNFVFTYISDKQKLHFLTPKGVPVELPVYFKYGQEVVDEYIKTQTSCKNKKEFGKPIAWGIEDHGDYFIVKTMVQEHVEMFEKEHFNNFKRSGVIGVDCNFDHFAWAETNAKGQLMNSGVFKFDLEGKTSGQITKIIEAEVIALVNVAVKTNKPIVVEKLDTTKSKASNLYGGKKANRYMSMFAYKKMLDALKSRASKENIMVFEVNPAYTSQIGKMKYMKQFGISIHVAASYVIARRGMGFKDKTPPVLRALLPEKIAGSHHWKHWSYVSRTFKEVRKDSFYRSSFQDIDTFSVRRELFVGEALTDYEQKCVEEILKKAPC